MVEGKPTIEISPKCRMLIKGLSGAYQFRRMQISGEEAFHDKPVKDSTSHVVESLHYLLLGSGEGPSAFQTDWIEETEVEAEIGFEGWHPKHVHGV